jgi:hypothetical protein
LTRALLIAVAAAAALAAVTAGVVYVFARTHPHRRPAPAAEPVPGPIRLSVLAAEDAGRAIVIRPRAAGARDGFSDPSLARALGLAPGTWRFVEVWVVNRGSADLASLATAPAVALRGGRSAPLRLLSELPAGSDPRPAGATMLARNLFPDPTRPLGKALFRRTVYALPEGAEFGDLLSAEADGLKLALRETTDLALEAFLERPRADVLAALSEQADGHASTRDASPEDAR